MKESEAQYSTKYTCTQQMYSHTKKPLCMICDMGPEKIPPLTYRQKGTLISVAFRMPLSLSLSL